MASNFQERKALAGQLMELHPGIPNEEVAIELVESFYMAFRKMLLSRNEVNIDGVGTFKVSKYKGGVRKKDPLHNKEYLTTPRKVLRFSVSNSMKKILNIDRKPSTVVKENLNEC